jgi:hypothetical protein
MNFNESNIRYLVLSNLDRDHARRCHGFPADTRVVLARSA